MNVYTLMEGERYEGGRVIGVYGSLEAGLRAAEKVRLEEEANGLMAWAGEWQEAVNGHTGAVVWTRAIDWLELRKWEVSE